MSGLGLIQNILPASLAAHTSMSLPRTFAYRIGGRVAEMALDTTAFSVETTANAHARAGLLLTKLVSGMTEVRVTKTVSERTIGEPPFFLKKHDHFITSLDGKVDLLLAELSYDRANGIDGGVKVARGDDNPAILFTHGMFMNSNFGLFPIDGHGRIPNMDTLRTFLGFFAFLGFRVFYLHMRNCVHIQNRYMRNKSAYVTDPKLRPDLHGVRYTIPPDTTFDDLKRHDIGSALTHIVRDLGCERVVAMAHSLGGDMLYDYIGRGLPYSENIVGFAPLCSPLRWKFDDEALIRILVKISKNAEAINTFFEQVGNSRRTNPLAFLAERVRIGSEVLAGFSPATGFMYQVGTHLPWIRGALNTLRYTEDESEHVTPKTIGKFIRKCLEPMPPLMVEHFMRLVQSQDGVLTTHDGRVIRDQFPNIQIPILAIGGDRDGLANPARNIAPDFDRLGSKNKRILTVEGGDHFTTIAGKKAPKATWFEIAKWMHEMGFYPDYNADTLQQIYERHIA
ncbi:MAG: hypothetical protein HN337_04705 [Deltaproteobacteria bacterium]|jgi:pimeloyl-ACP methyl ester carboxylesterase|nr:hypothetical protein [Deltaproteobacteria bacterium]